MAHRHTICLVGIEPRNPVIERLQSLALGGCIVDTVPAPIFRRQQVYHFKLYSAGKHVSGVEVFVRNTEQLIEIERGVAKFLKTERSKASATSK